MPINELTFCLSSSQQSDSLSPALCRPVNDSSVVHPLLVKPHLRKVRARNITRCLARGLDLIDPIGYRYR